MFESMEVYSMLSVDQSVPGGMDLQEDLLIQYEAIMDAIPFVEHEFRVDHIRKASALLRQLSEHTRTAASELRRTNQGAISVVPQSIDQYTSNPNFTAS